MNKNASKTRWEAGKVSARESVGLKATRGSVCWVLARGYVLHRDETLSAEEHSNDPPENGVLGRAPGHSSVPCADDALVVDVHEDMAVSKMIGGKEEEDGEFDGDELEPADVFRFALPAFPALDELEPVEFGSDDDSDTPGRGGVREDAKGVVRRWFRAEAHGDVGAVEVRAPPFEVSTRGRRPRSLHVRVGGRG